LVWLVNLLTLLTIVVINLLLRCYQFGFKVRCPKKFQFSAVLINLVSSKIKKKKMDITLGHSSSYEYPEKKRGSIEELHKRN